MLVSTSSPAIQNQILARPYQPMQEEYNDGVVDAHRDFYYED